ncbi:MAG: alpha/beta fold hydrolase [Burkholderiaceae bacterium]|nr:MAG: alpha/beta fold hydrolase [Burkholderiaceae bacterium]TAM11670.1 MAG: alpha/beta fold hydrolase [Pusillimonas sp.]
MATSHRLILSDGCAVHVEETGHGQPIMLIPGLGGLADFWLAIRDRLLPMGYRVISFDHRGTGNSDAPLGPYVISRIVRDVIEITQALSVNNVHVVGHSTGGLIAQGVALDSPDLVDKLVLSGSWAQPDEAFKNLFTLRLGLLQSGMTDLYQRLTIHLGYPPEWVSKNWSSLAPTIARPKLSAAQQAVACARLEMLLNEDHFYDLHKLTCKTLVIGASDDCIIPCHHSKMLHSSIPHAQFLTLEGGHFFPKVIPDKYTDAVHSFLSSKT